MNLLNAVSFAALTLLFFLSSKSCADDVYNYVFSKSPEKTSAMVIEPVPKLRWEIHGGIFRIVDPVMKSGGESLGLKYNLSRYWSIGANLMKAESNEPNIQESLDGALGVWLKPVRGRAFGYDLIDVSFGVGAMTTRYLSGGRNGREAKFYWGTELLINLSATVSFLFDIRVNTERATLSQADFGIAVRI
jgi:hypothetical protein